MEDLSPSRPATVDLLTRSDRNVSDDSRPRRPVSLKTTSRVPPAPILDTDADKEEKHQLDELA
jgi:hypothetical protein